MKTPIYLIIIALLYSITSCAQNRFAEGTITAKKEKFRVTKSNTVSNNQKYFFIHAQKNKYSGPIPPPANNYQYKILKKDIHINLDKVQNIIYDVLKAKRQALHDKGELFGINFIFETSGTLTDNNYTLLENTIITPAEIELIDNKLRAGIKVTFSGIDFKYYQAVNYNIPDIPF